MTDLAERRQQEFDVISRRLVDTLGGDYDSNGLVRAAQKSLAGAILPTEQAEVVYGATVGPETRSTGVGSKIGELLGLAYMLGASGVEALDV